MSEKLTRDEALYLLELVRLHVILTETYNIPARPARGS
jgi:hypothetical protein